MCDFLTFCFKMKESIQYTYRCQRYDIWGYCAGVKCFVTNLYLFIIVSELTLIGDSQTAKTLPSGDHSIPIKSSVSVSKCCKLIMVIKKIQI